MGLDVFSLNFFETLGKISAVSNTGLVMLRLMGVAATPSGEAKSTTCIAFFFSLVALWLAFNFAPYAMFLGILYLSLGTLWMLGLIDLGSN